MTSAIERHLRAAFGDYHAHPNQQIAVRQAESQSRNVFMLEQEGSKEHVDWVVRRALELDRQHGPTLAQMGRRSGHFGQPKPFREWAPRETLENADQRQVVRTDGDAVRRAVQGAGYRKDDYGVRSPDGTYHSRLRRI